MITTVAVAVVAGLQTDADIRADVANCQSQDYAVQTAGELFRQGLRSDFDLGATADSTKDALEATVLELTALERESTGDAAGAETLRQRADVASARSERVAVLSILMTDPPYAPSRPGSRPGPATSRPPTWKSTDSSPCRTRPPMTTGGGIARATDTSPSWR